MKIGNYYLNPYAVVAAHIAPYLRSVSLYVQGAVEPFCFLEGKPGYEEAIAFVEKMEAHAWKDPSDLYGVPASTTAPTPEEKKGNIPFSYLSRKGDE